MNNIKQQLKNLGQIEPRPEFILSSRRIILASPQQTSPWVGFSSRLKESLSFTFGIAVTAAVLIMLFSGFYLYNGRSASVANFQLTQKEAEVSIKNIDIALNEIRYYTETAKQTSLALTEAATNNESPDFNQIILEEVPDFNPEIKIINPEINDLLNQVIF